MTVLLGEGVKSSSACMWLKQTLICRFVHCCHAWTIMLPWKTMNVNLKRHWTHRRTEV